MEYVIQKPAVWIRASAESVTGKTLSRAEIISAAGISSGNINLPCPWSYRIPNLRTSRKLIMSATAMLINIPRLSSVRRSSLSLLKMSPYINAAKAR